MASKCESGGDVCGGDNETVVEIIEPLERVCWLLCAVDTAEEFFSGVESEPWNTDNGAKLAEVLRERRRADGLTALHISITEDREIEVIEWLIEHGSDVEAVTEDRIFKVGELAVLPIVAGRNLLHLAFRCGAAPATKAWLADRYPAMQAALDANGLRADQLTPSMPDDPRPSQRRLLRSGDVQDFERFVGCTVAEFFVVPDRLEVLAPGLTAFQMLTTEQCDLLERFLQAHQPTEITRPNTMNHYGVNLATSAFSPVLDHLMIDWLPALLRRHCHDAEAPFLTGALPIPDVAASFRDGPHLNPDFEFTSQYSFTIEYFGLKHPPTAPLAPTTTPDGDGGAVEIEGNASEQRESGRDRLAFHYDKSYFTVNLCMGLPDQLQGSTLYFDYTGKHDPFDFASTHDLFPVRHRRGWAIGHAGTLYHGASPIVKEQRKNLVIWGR